jgi:hypothetical protein
MIWALSIALLVSVIGNVLSGHWLLRELRVTHQQARARINELEGERTSLVNQVAEARGVTTDDTISSEKPHRDFAVDHQTGNTLYADGTVVAPDGSILVEPGDGELTADMAARAL